MYKSGNLTPEVKLAGHFKGSSNRQADVDSILKEIDDALDEPVRRKQKSC